MTYKKNRNKISKEKQKAISQNGGIIMLVTTKEMFKKSMEEGFAIGAFNVNNMEIIQGIVDAAAESKSPVILQASSSAIKYARIGYLMKMVQAAVEEHPEVPIAIHLDHGPDFETAKMCIDNGFTSVMIDGSSLPFEENVAKTKEIVAYAHERNVTVEAEIGHVGEGDSYHVEGNTMLTTPEEAKKFVEQTGVDSLAVSIGTAHGEYKGTPHLNFERLQEIAAEVSVPLVLHGGSGSGDENLSKAVELGIAKVNICTDLLNAARDNTKDGYAERSYYDSVTLAKDGFKDCLKHYYEVFHTK